MKRIAIVLAMAVLVLGAVAQAKQLAFPGAEGYGCYATGGRGGDVYHVTNLTDSVTNPQPGSLRYGLLTATGPRTIVFDISGYIDLSARLQYSSDNITIAGQTAPGDGITLRHWDVRPYLADNGIIRYIRVRVGHYPDQESPPPEMPIHGGLDALSVEGCKNFIIDHVSASWGVDEIASITGDSNDITVQWCFLVEPLNVHSHAYISLLRPAMTGKFTHHHNLYTDCIQRLTRFGNYNDNVVDQYDWVNNVGYNWGSQSTYSYDNNLLWDYVVREGGTAGTDGEFVNLNFIRNYFIKGPNTGSGTAANAGYDCTGISNPSHRKIWGENNYWDPDKDAQHDGTDVGWSVTGAYTAMTGRHPITSPLTIDTAPVAYDRVLNYGGNWLVRDSADIRIVNEVRTRTGAIINTEADVGGFPVLNSVSRPAGFDTDGDGMPTAWEEARWWLNPNDANDRNGDNDNDGYTNLEEYLNYLVVWQNGIPGDYDADNDVDMNDLAMFIDDWLVVDSVFVPAGDFDGDNDVDFNDFAIFAAGWTGP